MIVLALALAASADLPQGVVWHAPTERSERRAQERLDAALAKDTLPERLLARAPQAGRHPAMVGTFATQALPAVDGYDQKRLAAATNKFPLTQDMVLDAPITGAQTPDQRRHLAMLLSSVLPADAPAAIRRPTFDELALTWMFIGWDLDGPLLVAEWNDARYLFDFDADGKRVEWIERLDSPCFALASGGKQLLDCHCIVIERREQAWTAMYERSDAMQCPAAAAEQMSD